MFTPIYMGLGATLGILLGLLLSRPKKNQVFKILPNEHRGFDLNVIKEHAMFLHAEPIGDLPPQRFLKYRPGITVLIKRRFGRVLKITRFLAREGTAYTQKLQAGKIENVPLAKTMEILWGETEYNKIPKVLKDKLETSKIGVTVSLADDPLTPHSMPSISEEDIKTEEDQAASETFWKGRKSTMRGQAMQSLAWIGFGFGIALAIGLLMGWIQLASFT